jgi:hypothetical protein
MSPRPGRSQSGADCPDSSPESRERVWIEGIQAGDAAVWTRLTSSLWRCSMVVRWKIDFNRMRSYIPAWMPDGVGCRRSICVAVPVVAWTHPALGVLRERSTSRRSTRSSDWPAVAGHRSALGSCGSHRGQVQWARVRARAGRAAARPESKTGRMCGCCGRAVSRPAPGEIQPRSAVETPQYGNARMKRSSAATSSGVAGSGISPSVPLALAENQ